MPQLFLFRLLPPRYTFFRQQGDFLSAHYTDEAALQPEPGLLGAERAVRAKGD